MIFLTLSEIFTDTGVQLFGSPVVFGLILLIAIAFLMLVFNMPVGFLLMAGGLVVVYLSRDSSSFNIILGIFGVIVAGMIAMFFWKMFQSGD
jgi:hypothetical protein